MVVAVTGCKEATRSVLVINVQADNTVAEFDQLSVTLYGLTEEGECDVPVAPDGSLIFPELFDVDDEGYVTIRDRAKEMIKYKGYQIAPAELEAVLIEHPDVADAAVIPKDAGNGMDGSAPAIAQKNAPAKLG